MFSPQAVSINRYYPCALVASSPFLFVANLWKANSKNLGWNDAICPHTDAERALRGTWCTLGELQKAVAMGYRIIKIHEIWHFLEEDRRVGLFADYVNTWLKIKQECAGWPENCVTPEQKAACIQAYEQTEGIKLENVTVTWEGKRSQN